MSLFVEVFDVKKGCQVIVNLEHVVEITPLRTGGCEMAFNDSASVSGKRVVNVKEEFTVFQQLVMHMVTPEAMSQRIAKIKADAAPAAPVQHVPESKTAKTTKKSASVDEPLHIPKL